MTEQLRPWVAALVGLSGCALGDDVADLDELAQAADVTEWQNMVGVAADGNTLTKTATATNWHSAGASSVATLYTDGYLELTPVQRTTGRMIGLSNGDSNLGYTEIDHAFYLAATSRLRFYEAGDMVETEYAYIYGDDTMIRMQVTEGVVSFVVDSEVQYTSPIPVTFPLRVDTSFYSPGASISDIRLVDQGVTWQDLVGATADRNDLVKTATTTGWTAGATSVATIGAIGYVDFTTAENDTAKMLGLSRVDSDVSFADLEYAFYLTAWGDLRVFELGAYRGTFGTYAPGDRLRIDVVGQQVRYMREGVTLYTSTVAPIFPLHVDTSLRTPGATLRDVIVHDAGFLYTGGAYLKASTLDVGDGFGAATAISGDTLVVGAPSEDSNATGINGNQASDSAANSGAVYVFVRSGASWVQQAYIKPHNTGSGDEFGSAVAIDGNTVVVGARWKENTGSAYVFTRSGSTWSQQAYLKASNPGVYDRFGEVVDISAGTIVVGAPDEDSAANGINGNQNNESAPGRGAAYVFVRTGSTWSQQAYVKPAGPVPHAFGRAVGIDGNRMAIGATSVVEMFARSGSAWAFDAGLTPVSPVAFFGEALALSGTTLATQVKIDDWYHGAVQVFVRTGTGWILQAQMEPPQHKSFYGESIALDGDILVVGEPTDNVYANWSGAAYRYDRTGTTWGPATLLKAPNAAYFDGLGAVAVSGSTVVAGAGSEDGGVAGVDGNQNDNSLTNAGAVFVFE